MQLSQETSRAAEYLRGIFESGKTLRLSEPKRLTGGNSYLFVATADGKESDFCLTREQLDDLPGTKEYREAANAFARALESRFMNTNPDLFVSSSGRVLHISPDWPALPLLNPEGRGYISASGTRVAVKDSLSQEIAICMVKMTHSQALPGPHSTPFDRLAAIVNSIRSDVDTGRIIFHPTFDQHPKIMQNVDFRFDATTPNVISESQYLQQKVWLLGFRSGNKETKVWIADPWDAFYIRSNVNLLRQEAAILDARALIRLDESEEFASVGKGLLSQNGPKPSLLHSSALPKPAPQVSQDFDVFISHSTVDKPYVEPLVEALGEAGITVWFDKASMEWGDNLRSEIDRGLTACRYGIVVFSKAFLNKKKWTEHELNALFAREEGGRKIILPIWHGITREDLVQYSPAFADRLAKNSLTNTYSDIVQSLLLMLGPAKLNVKPPASASTAESVARINAASKEASGLSLSQSRETPEGEAPPLRPGNLPIGLRERIDGLKVSQAINDSLMRVLTSDRYPEIMSLSTEAVINPIWGLISATERAKLSNVFSPFGNLPPRIMHLDIFLLRSNDELGRPYLFNYYSGKPVSGWQAYMLPFRHRRPGETEGSRQQANALDIASFFGVDPEIIAVETLGGQFVVSVKPDVGYSELVAYIFEFCTVEMKSAPEWMKHIDCTLELHSSVRRFRWCHPEEMERQDRSMLVDGDVIRGVQYFFGTTLPEVPIGFPAILPS